MSFSTLIFVQTDVNFWLTIGVHDLGEGRRGEKKKVNKKTISIVTTNRPKIRETERKQRRGENKTAKKRSSCWTTKSFELESFGWTNDKVILKIERKKKEEKHVWGGKKNHGHIRTFSTFL